MNREEYRLSNHCTSSKPTKCIRAIQLMGVGRNLCEATLLLIWSYGLDCLWGLADVDDVGAAEHVQTLHLCTIELGKI